MITKQLEAYAELLLKTGVNLQNNQPLLISAEVESKDFVIILTEMAYKLGAKDVTVNWRCNSINRARLLQAKEDVLAHPRAWIPEYYKNHLEENCAFISLISANPKALENIPVQRISLQSRAMNETLEFYHRAIMTSSHTWCVAAVATPLWADLLGYEGSLEEKVEQLWNTIFTLCRNQKNNESEPFSTHLGLLEKRRTTLTDLSFTKLHYTASNGTDLWVGLPKNHIWQGGAEYAQNNVLFTANIPTEEVYSAPQFNEVNGVVYATKPLIYHGNTIDEFSLTFKEGKVISYEAKVGEEYLKELLETDEGSSYLGEVALVDHYSPISQSNQIYFETLFDENASCHLALGAAYPTCLKDGERFAKEELKERGLNHSLTHVDFMIGHEDMTIIGVTAEGKEFIIMEKGRLQL